jgi:hypothetical protein
MIIIRLYYVKEHFKLPFSGIEWLPYFICLKSTIASTHHSVILFSNFFQYTVYKSFNFLEIFHIISFAICMLLILLYKFPFLVLILLPKEHHSIIFMCSKHFHLYISDVYPAFSHTTILGRSDTLLIVLINS